MSQYKIAPSILAADYANFEREIKRLEATGAEYAHIDNHGWSLCTTNQFWCRCGRSSSPS